jgi:predicted nucleotidyltransferase
LLNDEDVEYVIIGGYAVAKHGYPRYTGDLDIFISGTPENAEKLVSVMFRFGFGPYDFEALDFIGNERFISFGDEPFKIELLTSTLGVSFEEVFQNKVTIETEGVRINFIAYRDLILNKKAVGRPKDLLDLENLPPPNEA